MSSNDKGGNTVPDLCSNRQNAFTSRGASAAMDGTDVQRTLDRHINVVGGVLARGMQTGGIGTFREAIRSV